MKWKSVLRAKSSLPSNQDKGSKFKMEGGCQHASEEDFMLVSFEE